MAAESRQWGTERERRPQVLTAPGPPYLLLGPVALLLLEAAIPTPPLQNVKPQVRVCAAGVSQNRLKIWDFPGGPVFRTPRFHCPGPGSIRGWGTKIPQAVWRGQKKKKEAQNRLQACESKDWVTPVQVSSPIMEV